MAIRRAARRLPRGGGGRAPRRLLAALALLLAAVGVTSQLSGATFTSSTTTGVTVGAADDWTPPTVSVTSPGATVSGTVTVSATASDARSSVARVVIEHAAAGSSTWIALCTDTTAPYSCAWGTTMVADGDHQLRATATDAVGLSTNSAVVTTTVANAAIVRLAAIADTVRGTVPLGATVSGAGGRSVTSSFEYRVSGSSDTWTVVTGCGAVTGTSPTCSWGTSGLTGSYDVRVVSAVGSTRAIDTRVGVTVDNTAPTITMDVPSPMSGTMVLSPAVADSGSGVAQVAFAYRPSLSSTWTDLCTTTAAPHRCSLDTTKLMTGATYDVRAIVTDRAGNTAQVVATRLVQNVTASVALTSPTSGAGVKGTVVLTADANAATGSTVTSVEFRRRVAGTAEWTTVCTATTAPYSCSWNTTGGGVAPQGSYELQAVMTQRSLLGSSTVSSAAVPVYVDNVPLTGAKVEAVNGGAAETVGSGDTLVLEWSALVNPATVLAGWGGSQTSVTVTIVGGKGSGSGDTATFGGTNLGTVDFGSKYVGNNSTVTVPATMVATTVNGSATRVTLRFGAPAGSVNTNVATTGGARWTSSSSVRTPGGTASATTVVTGSAAW